MNIDEMRFNVWVVTSTYTKGGTVYPRAAFPTKELAESYVRYSKLTGGDSPSITHTIQEFPYYNIDFETSYYTQSQGKLEFTKDE